MGEEQVREPSAPYAATVGEAMDILQRYPLPVNADRLRDSVNNVEQQIAVYKSIVRQFEARHECTLEVFERRIAQGEIAEHPSWEEALEWGVALDEIERLGVIQRALQWILNFLHWARSSTASAAT